MKKLGIVLLACVLVLGVCACSSQEPDNSLDLETQYYDYAQQCISEGKTDEAKQALEEGIAQIDSEKLKNLLNELNGESTEPADGTESTTEKTDATTEKENSAANKETTTTKSEVAKNEYEQYVGEWYCPGYREGNGGLELQLEIGIQEERMAIIFKLFDTGSPETFGSQIKQVVSLSEIKEGTLRVSYDNDGNGHSGVMEFVFLKDRIICISEYDEPEESDWGCGFYFESEILVKEETADDLFD